MTSWDFLLGVWIVTDGLREPGRAVSGVSTVGKSERLVFEASGKDSVQCTVQLSESGLYNLLEESGYGKVE